jgi:L-rhamnose mutarotase
MERACFVLQVKKDRIAEYAARHASVWPDMLDALRKAGWHNYSLFLRDDGLLIGYVETPDFIAAQQKMEQAPINAFWQSEMEEYFEHLSGLSPDRSMFPLREVFHLD